MATQPITIPDNTIHGFLQACEGLGWKVRHNTSCREIEILYEDEWRTLSEKHLLSQIVDTLTLRCRIPVKGKEGGCRVAKFVRGNVEQHLETISETCRHNELLDWLESLPAWDGEDRISGLFADMYGAEDTGLNRWAANAVFWQVVDRIVEGQHGRSGTSHRATILFAGPQTCGKTAFVREMLPRRLRSRYLVEGLNFGMDRDALIRACCGRLLVEVGEFGVGRDLEATKSFITAAADVVNPKFQKPYTTARSFVMVGGFNPENATPLARDLSGNSRFVVVEFKRRCDDVPAHMDAVRDQLWAQAWHRYRELPEHYRWVPDRLADEQSAGNEAHQYVNEALAAAAFDAFGGGDVKEGTRLSIAEIHEKLNGFDDGRLTPERMSSKWQSEVRRTLVQTGLFEYRRDGRAGRAMPGRCPTSSSAGTFRQSRI